MAGWLGRRENGPWLRCAVSRPVGRGCSGLSDIGPLPHRKECGEVTDRSPEEIIAQRTGESPGVRQRCGRGV